MNGNINFNKIALSVAIGVCSVGLISQINASPIIIGTISYEPLENQVASVTDFNSVRPVTNIYDNFGAPKKLVSKGLYTFCNYYSQYHQLSKSVVMNTTSASGGRFCPSESDAFTDSNVLSAYNTEYNYDDSKTLRLTSLTFNDKKTTYTYNPNGSLSVVTYPDGSHVNYSYYPDGVPLGYKDVNGMNTHTSYLGDNGAPDKVVYFPGDISSIKSGVNLQFSYDEFGRVHRITYPNNIYLEKEYDKYGRVISLIYYKDDGSQLLNVAITGYSQFGNILSETVTDASSRSASSAFVYDKLNRLTQFTCSGSICPKDASGKEITKITYTYDFLNNLTTAVINNGAQTITYKYEDTQHPSRMTGVVDSDVGSSESKIIYDNGGEGPGNVTQDDLGNTYTYNPFDQMITAHVVKNAQLITYAYNHDGQLVTEKLGNAVPMTYQYAGSVLTGLQQGNQKINYFQKAAKYQNNDLRHGEIYLSDYKGSVLATATVQGSAIDREFSYMPFGQVSVITSNHPLPLQINQHAIGFDGQITDNNTGFQLLGNGYRAYNARLRRFMQADVSSPFGVGGINPYAFVSDNPIMGTDPSGHGDISEGMNGTFLAIGLLAAAAAPFTGGSSLAVAASVVSGLLGAASAGAGLAADEMKSKTAQDVSIALGALAGALDVASVGSGIIAAEDGLKTAGEETLNSEKEAAEITSAAKVEEANPCSFSKDTKVVVVKRNKAGKIVKDKHGKPEVINKKISKIKVGKDFVMSYDVKHDKTTFNRVMAKIVSYDGTTKQNQLVDVKVMDSHGHVFVIHTTANHPFAVVQ